MLSSGDGATLALSSGLARIARQQDHFLRKMLDARIDPGIKNFRTIMTRRRHQGRPETSHTPSQRQLRVGELVRHAFADLLARGAIHDPVIQEHVITVPEVRMAADLRHATIYVMPLGGRDADAVLAALDRNKRFLRGEIARRINLKFAPEVRFRIDERFDEAERIEKLLRTPAVQRDLHGKDEDT
jgi:ribosome-binding factor A